MKNNKPNLLTCHAVSQYSLSALLSISTLALLSTSSWAAQIVEPMGEATLFVTAGDTVNVQPLYSVTEPQTGSETGLGLQLHFNDQVLQFQELDNIYTTDSLGSASPQNDEDDDDNDASTNQYLATAWLNIMSLWPGANNLPLPLYQASFEVKSGFTGSTTVNFFASSKDARAEFQSTPYTLCAKPTLSFDETALTFNEATDNNNNVTINLSHALPAECGNLEIHFQTGGTASSGSDYEVMASSPITLASGENSFVLPITIIDDADIENDETLTLSLSNQNNYLVDATGSPLTITIISDDTAPDDTTDDGNTNDNANNGDNTADNTGNGDNTADNSGNGDNTADNAGNGDNTADNSGSGDNTADNTGNGDNTADNTGNGDNTTDNSGSGDNTADNTGNGDNTADNSGSGDNTADNTGNGDNTADNSGNGDNTTDNAGNSDSSNTDNSSGTDNNNTNEGNTGGSGAGNDEDGTNDNSDSLSNDNDDASKPNDDASNNDANNNDANNNDANNNDANNNDASTDDASNTDDGKSDDDVLSSAENWQWENEPEKVPTMTHWMLMLLSAGLFLLGKFGRKDK